MNLIPYKEKLHLESVCDIEAKCFPVSIAYDREKLKKHFRYSKGQVYVLEYGPNIVGYCWYEWWPKNNGLSFREYFRRNKPAQPRKYKDVLYIANVSVLPQYRKNGYGIYMVSSMLQDVIKYAILTVADDNEPAINIYKEFGFKTIDVIDSYYVPGDRALVMAWEKK